MTPNFSLTELTYSDTAVRLGIANLPTEVEIANLHLLAGILEQVRRIFDSPVTVSSGFRCPALNKAVGGAATSAHLHGLAADFTVRGVSVKDTVRTLKMSNLPYDQLIEEHTSGASWVHIGLRAGNWRRQTLLYKNGKYSVWTN